MKKIVVIFCYLLSCNCVFGQVLVDTGKEWNNLLNSEEGFGVASQLIRFGSDTTVNILTYKKVLKATSDIAPNWTLYGLIRETPDKKVYYKYDATSQESLLYDFGLHVNDTVVPTSLTPDNSCTGSYLLTLPMIVVSIDSVFIGDKEQKRLHMSPVGIGYETDQWIEGVGSKAGMLHNNYDFVGGCWYKLLCYYENDTVKYPPNPDCFVISSLETAGSGETSVSIAPNPVRDISTVSFSKPVNDFMKLEIFTSSGKKIRSMDIQDNMMIYRKDFIPGLYLFKFYDTSRTFSTIKVQIL